MAEVVIDADDAAALRRLFLDPVPSDDVVAAVSSHKGYPAQLLRLVLHPRNRDLTTCTLQTLHVLMDTPHDANGHAASAVVVAKACLARAAYYANQDPPPSVESVARNVRRVAALAREDDTDGDERSDVGESVRAAAEPAKTTKRRGRTTTTRRSRKLEQPSAEAPADRSQPTTAARTPSRSQHQAAGNDSSDGGEDPMQRPGLMSQFLLDNYWDRKVHAPASRPGFVRAWDEGDRRERLPLPTQPTSTP